MLITLTISMSCWAENRLQREGSSEAKDEGGWGKGGGGSWGSEPPGCVDLDVRCAGKES